jgi:hypothetical protein
MRLCATLILSAVTAASMPLAAQSNLPPPSIHPVAAPASSASASTAPAPPASGALIQVDSPTYDFGKATVGEKVHHVYMVTNTGTETLQITNVHPSCGCTTVGDWTHKIEPGHSGQIAVQFDTSRYGGAPVQKTIDVFSNAKNEPRKALLLKGTVWKPIDLLPATAVFSIAPDFNDQTNMTVRIVNQTDKPATMSNPVSANTNLFTAVLKEIKPGKEYALTITSRPPYNSAFVQGTITVATSLAASPTISVPVSANMPPAVQITPPQIMVNANPGRWITNRVSIHGNTTNVLALSDPKASDSRIHIEIQPMLPAKGTFSLVVAFPPDFQLEPGKTAEVTVQSNHPRFPLIQIPIRAYPRARQPTATPAHPNRPPAPSPALVTTNAAPAH